MAVMYRSKTSNKAPYRLHAAICSYFSGITSRLPDEAMHIADRITDLAQKGSYDKAHRLSVKYHICPTKYASKITFPINEFRNHIQNKIRRIEEAEEFNAENAAKSLQHFSPRTATRAVMKLRKGMSLNNIERQAFRMIARLQSLDPHLDVRWGPDGELHVKNRTLQKAVARNNRSKIRQAISEEYAVPITANSGAIPLDKYDPRSVTEQYKLGEFSSPKSIDLLDSQSDATSNTADPDDDEFDPSLVTRLAQQYKLDELPSPESINLLGFRKPLPTTTSTRPVVSLFDHVSDFYNQIRLGSINLERELKQNPDAAEDPVAARRLAEELNFIKKHIGYLYKIRNHIKAMGAVADTKTAATYNNALLAIQTIIDNAQKLGKFPSPNSIKSQSGSTTIRPGVPLFSQASYIYDRIQSDAYNLRVSMERELAMDPVAAHGRAVPILDRIKKNIGHLRRIRDHIKDMGAGATPETAETNNNAFLVIQNILDNAHKLTKPFYPSSRDATHIPEMHEIMMGLMTRDLRALKNPDGTPKYATEEEAKRRADDILESETKEGKDQAEKLRKKYWPLAVQEQKRLIDQKDADQQRILKQKDAYTIAKENQESSEASREAAETQRRTEREEARRQGLITTLPGPSPFPSIAEARDNPTSPPPQQGRRTFVIETPFLPRGQGKGILHDWRDKISLLRTIDNKPNVQEFFDKYTKTLNVIEKELGVYREKLAQDGSLTPTLRQAKLNVLRRHFINDPEMQRHRAEADRLLALFKPKAIRFDKFEADPQEAARTGPVTDEKGKTEIRPLARRGIDASTNYTRLPEYQEASQSRDSAATRMRTIRRAVMAAANDYLLKQKPNISTRELQRLRAGELQSADIAYKPRSASERLALDPLPPREGEPRARTFVIQSQQFDPSKESWPDYLKRMGIEYKKAVGEFRQAHQKVEYMQRNAPRMGRPLVMDTGETAPTARGERAPLLTPAMRIPRRDRTNIQESGYERALYEIALSHALTMPGSRRTRGGRLKTISEAQEYAEKAVAMFQEKFEQLPGDDVLDRQRRASQSVIKLLLVPPVDSKGQTNLDKEGRPIRLVNLSPVRIKRTLEAIDKLTRDDPRFTVPPNATEDQIEQIEAEKTRILREALIASIPSILSRRYKDLEDRQKLPPRESYDVVPLPKSGHIMATETSGFGTPRIPPSTPSAESLRVRELPIAKRVELLPPEPGESYADWSARWQQKVTAEQEDKQRAAAEQKAQLPLLSEKELEGRRAEAKASYIQPDPPEWRRTLTNGLVLKIRTPEEKKASLASAIARLGELRQLISDGLAHRYHGVRPSGRRKQQDEDSAVEEYMREFRSLRTYLVKQIGGSAKSTAKQNKIDSFQQDHYQRIIEYLKLELLDQYPGVANAISGLENAIEQKNWGAAYKIVRNVPRQLVRLQDQLARRQNAPKSDKRLPRSELTTTKLLPRQNDPSIRGSMLERDPSEGASSYSLFNVTPQEHFENILEAVYRNGGPAMEYVIKPMDGEQLSLRQAIEARDWESAHRIVQKMSKANIDSERNRGESQAHFIDLHEHLTKIMPILFIKNSQQLQTVVNNMIDSIVGIKEGDTEQRKAELRSGKNAPSVGISALITQLRSIADKPVASSGIPDKASYLISLLNNYGIAVSRPDGTPQPELHGIQWAIPRMLEGVKRSNIQVPQEITDKLKQLQTATDSEAFDKAQNIVENLKHTLATKNWGTPSDPDPWQDIERPLFTLEDKRLDYDILADKGGKYKKYEELSDEEKAAAKADHPLKVISTTKSGADNLETEEQYAARYNELKAQQQQTALKEFNRKARPKNQQAYKLFLEHRRRSNGRDGQEPFTTPLISDADIQAEVERAKAEAEKTFLEANRTLQIRSSRDPSITFDQATANLPLDQVKANLTKEEKEDLSRRIMDAANTTYTQLMRTKRHIDISIGSETFEGVRHLFKKDPKDPEGSESSDDNPFNIHVDSYLKYRLNGLDKSIKLLADAQTTSRQGMFQTLSHIRDGLREYIDGSLSVPDKVTEYYDHISKELDEISRGSTDDTSRLMHLANETLGDNRDNSNFENSESILSTIPGKDWQKITNLESPEEIWKRLDRQETRHDAAQKHIPTLQEIRDELSYHYKIIDDNNSTEEDKELARQQIHQVLGFAQPMMDNIIKDNPGITLDLGHHRVLRNKETLPTLKFAQFKDPTQIPSQVRAIGSLATGIPQELVDDPSEQNKAIREFRASEGREDPAAALGAKADEKDAARKVEQKRLAEQGINPESGIGQMMVDKAIESISKNRLQSMRAFFAIPNKMWEQSKAKALATQRRRIQGGSPSSSQLTFAPISTEIVPASSTPIKTAQQAGATVRERSEFEKDFLNRRDEKKKELATGPAGNEGADEHARITQWHLDRWRPLWEKTINGEPITAAQIKSQLTSLTAKDQTAAMKKLPSLEKKVKNHLLQIADGDYQSGHDGLREIYGWNTNADSDDAFVHGALAEAHGVPIWPDDRKTFNPDSEELPPSYDDEAWSDGHRNHILQQTIKPVSARKTPSKPRMLGGMVQAPSAPAAPPSAPAAPPSAPAAPPSAPAAPPDLSPPPAPENLSRSLLRYARTRIPHKSFEAKPFPFRMGWYQ